MTKLKSLSLLATLGMLAGTAQAAPPIAPDGAGWYYDVSGGALWLQDISVGGASLDFDTGWALNAELGYDLGNGLALGVNAGYYTADLGSLSGHDFGVDAGGDISAVPVLGNVRFSHHLTQSLSINLGVGLGVVYTESGIDESNDADVSGFRNDSWEFGFQALAGLQYHITDGTSVGVGYRYLHVDDSDLQGHLLQASVNFRW